MKPITFMQPTLVSRPRRLAVKAHLFALRTSIMCPIHSAASPRNGWDGAVQPEEGATTTSSHALVPISCRSHQRRRRSGPARAATSLANARLRHHRRPARHRFRGRHSCLGQRNQWHSSSHHRRRRSLDSMRHPRRSHRRRDDGLSRRSGLGRTDRHRHGQRPRRQVAALQNDRWLQDVEAVFRNPDSPDGFFDCVWFQRTGYGILLGDPVKDRFAVFETADGGKTWKRDTRIGLNVKGTRFAAFAASNSLFPHFSERLHARVCYGRAGRSTSR